EPPLAQGEQPENAGICLQRRSHGPFDKNLAGGLDRRELKLLFGTKVGKEARLAELERLGHFSNRQRLESFAAGHLYRARENALPGFRSPRNRDLGCPTGAGLCRNGRVDLFFSHAPWIASERPFSKRSFDNPEFGDKFGSGDRWAS